MRLRTVPLTFFRAYVSIRSMTKQSNKKVTNKKNTSVISELEKFNLGFELNIPWNQASQTVQHRPTKK